MRNDMLQTEEQASYIDKGADYVNYNVDAYQPEPYMPTEQTYTNTIHQRPGMVGDALRSSRRSGSGTPVRWWK